MRKNIIYEDENNKPTTPNETLKATSLVYFKEALLKQEYEDCKEFVRTAKRFGAEQSEITAVIDEYLGKGQGGRQGEAYRNITGRPRF